MNYFEYFSEIEERFSRRRGSLLLLSTLDWALIETWREGGIPLAAVLRGIDAAFDKHDTQLLRAKGRARKVNSLAWCSQAVMQAAEDLVEASTGLPVAAPEESTASGFEAERIAAFLDRNAGELQAGAATAASHATAELIAATAARLHQLAAQMRSPEPPALDELDRTLTVLEERLVDALRAAASESELVGLRETADRELAPYRGRMAAVQLRQVATQLQHKRLLESARIPRLSLFYMGHGE